MGNKGVTQNYAAAGVNIDVAAKAKELIRKEARSTHRPEVLSGVGFFGGLFEFRGYNQPVLVSSVDGIGTKLKIASALNKHETVGIDLVNHCVNDILTCGAEPLFFLDYIATGKLVPAQVAAIAHGMAHACREVGCALIGGETAEMPGIYAGEDYDLVGFIIGVVEKEKIILGKTIVAGDTIIGLPSSGLHTNGYSLVRRLFGVDQLKKDFPELGHTLGEELLEPHRCYYNQLKLLLPNIKGMAHITGGGLVDNVPRVLPQGLAANFDRRAWTIPPIFQLIQRQGNVAQEEMYRVFNMGIGMVVVCAGNVVEQLVKAMPEAKVIGEVVKQAGEKRVVIK
jgi:phosphoribosylformylglycinamidine cyclo-ligase